MNAGKVFAIVGAGKLSIDRRAFVRRFNVIQRSDRINQTKMRELDKLLETYGVEYLEKKDTKKGLLISYLNVGDPYVPTLVCCNAWAHPIKLSVGGYASYVK